MMRIVLESVEVLRSIFRLLPRMKPPMRAREVDDLRLQTALEAREVLQDEMKTHGTPGVSSREATSPLQPLTHPQEIGESRTGAIIPRRMGSPAVSVLMPLLDPHPAYFPEAV